MVPVFTQFANNSLEGDEIEHIAIRGQRAASFDPYAIIVAVQWLAGAVKGDKMCGTKPYVAMLYENLPHGRYLTLFSWRTDCWSQPERV
jgi:hypothetical protein